MHINVLDADTDRRLRGWDACVEGGQAVADMRRET